jgi:hypothetical protein
MTEGAPRQYCFAGGGVYVSLLASDTGLDVLRPGTSLLRVACIVAGGQ